MLKQSTPLYQQAYEEIKRSILSGKYKPGMTIPVSQLVEEFQISRTPLKEALRQLQNEGLLELKPMGPKVIQLSRKDSEDLCYCRLVLERELIGLVVDVISEEQLNEAEHVLQEAKNCLQEGAPINTVMEYNSRFHEVIMKACPNQMLVQLLEHTRNKLVLYRAIAIIGDKEQQQVIDDHYDIVLALKKRDKQQAIEAVEKHLLNDQLRYNMVIDRMEKEKVNGQA